MTNQKYIFLSTWVPVIPVDILERADDPVTVVQPAFLLLAPICVSVFPSSLLNTVLFGYALLTFHQLQGKSMKDPEGK